MTLLRKPLLALLATLSLTCVAAEPQYFPEADASLPFSEAVEVNGLLFLSGQIGLAPGSDKLVPGGIGPETKATMELIKGVLERHGSSLDHVVKCNVFIADINERAAMNAVYATYFPNHKPARSTFGTSGLSRGARVEIECIAAVK